MNFPLDKSTLYTLRDLVRTRAIHNGDGLAYVFLGDDLQIAEQIGYAELGRSARAIAAALAARQVRPGDRVLLAFSNGLDAIRLFWGCIEAGAIPVPAPAPDPRNARLSGSRLAGMVADARAALAVTAAERLAVARSQVPDVEWISLDGLLCSPGGRVQAGLSQPEPEDVPAKNRANIAYLQYTSGSTSQPRGVEITHGNALAQCEALDQCLSPGRMRALVWLPWFHDYGLVHGVLQPIYTGGVCFFMSTVRFLLRPLKWLEAIAQHRIVHSGAPNFAYAACVKALERAPGWSARLDTWALATCGAEPVRAATLDAFVRAFAPHGFNARAFAPSYGLAEAVLAVTVHTAHDTADRLTLDGSALEAHAVRPADAGLRHARTLVNCGPALPGYGLRITDPVTHQPCTSNQVGEIWVSGPGVGRGYWSQPEATAAQFVTMPGESDNSGETVRYLRTGDLGFLQNGELFVAGRLKDMLLVHGRNLYPQDLEQTAELAHPGVRPGGVIAISVERDEREAIVLLVECSRRPAPDAVRVLLDAVRSHVAAEHEIGLADIVPLRAGTLPRTSSGKPQRRAARSLYLQGRLAPLRLPAAAGPADAAEGGGGDGDGRQALAESLRLLWTEVLGQAPADPSANFFDLGGDSLTATQLVSRIRTQWGINLPISAIFETPTLAGLARRLADAPRAAATAESQGTAETPPLSPLSSSQERMWFMHALAPEGSAYNIPLAMRLNGVRDHAALRATLQTALDRAVQRHDILRTRFMGGEQGVTAEVAPTLAIGIEDVALLTDDPAQDEALHRHLAAFTARPFRLDRLPLLRAQYIHTGEQAAVLLIVAHHIIGDQWSFAALGQELAAHHNAALRGEDAALPTLPLQYADYAAWHRRHFSGARHERELAHWRQQLQGLEPLSLHTDFARPRQPDFQGARVRLPLAPADIAALTALGAAHGASLSMVLISALKVLLARYTGKTDIAIGVPIANRHHLASENLIGTFVNTLVLRTGLDGEPDFLAVLARVRRTALQAFDHQDMPFEQLVRALGDHADPGGNPLFSVMFNMVNVQARECRFDGLEWSRLDFDRCAAQFDLAVIADTLYDRSIVLEYATALFEHATIERMGRHLMRIMRAAIDTPGLCVNAYPLPDAGETALLRRWSLGPRDIDTTGLTVNDWVRRGAQARPGHTALIAGEARLSHQVLDEAACRLARVLRERGIGRGDRVGLRLGRSADLVVAQLGVLKAGAAYVPLDPDHPLQRLAYQVEDAGLALLVTHSAIAAAGGADLAQGSPVPRLLLDDDAALIADASSEPLPPDLARDARPEDPAYLIYTSGSTGQPKGVAVPHRAVVNFLASMARAPGLTPDDRLLAVTTPGFDIAVLELLLPLAEGATVVLADEQQVVDGRALAQLIEAEAITVLQATPSRWQLLLDAGWQGRPGFKALVGGEPLTPNLATQLLARCAAVWNMYGPTETTVWSSCWRVAPDQVQRIALGEPVAHTSVQVLDARRQPAPIGVPGEIWIGGLGVALGYHGRPDLTTERFVAQPGADEPEYRLIYRTGDRGRWRSDGTLEHGGRLDDQVKLRGFRIELGEVESRLLAHPRIARAVVLLREDAPGQPRLVAYVVEREGMPDGHGALREQLREHLGQWLPGHMVPGHFVEVPAIPLLPNGKTDRRALPAPAGPGQQRRRWVAPRNAAEQDIWGIWSEALQSSDFGVHDDFFDLGGHSILAVRVVSRMEAVLQQSCPLSLLFEHPSVAGLAQAMAARGTLAHRDVPIVALQPHGSGPGLFLLAGAEMYRPLAQALDVPDMRVYGVFSQTEIDLLEPAQENQPRDIDVPQLATEYLAIIRQQQPRGPYYLGGFSIGGVLAYEVARRLRQAGEEVRLLALLDTMLPGHGWRHVLAGIDRRLRLIRRQGSRHLLHVQRVLRQQNAQRDEPGGRRNRVYASAIRRYDAQRDRLPAVFLQAGDDPSTVSAYGWPRLLPGLRVERVPGRHMDILEPPCAAMLATRLRVHLVAARGVT